MPKKDAVIVHSGGMDSSLCLKLALDEFGKENVLSLTFDYGQRHRHEIDHSRQICDEWGVNHIILKISCLSQITNDALVNHCLCIEHKNREAPNTLVMGRNGLMARIAAIQAHSLGAKCIYLGVLELEESNSGYRDCSRKYMDMMQEILRIDFDDPEFEIRTPLVSMTKLETMELADRLGILNFLLEKTITCYEGIPYYGCQKCPSCLLKNQGIEEYAVKHPDFSLPISYRFPENSMNQ